MQLNFDKDEFTGDVVCVPDPRGGWGVAIATEHGTLTIFGDARALFRRAAMALDFAMGEPEGLVAVKGVLESLPAGTLGFVPSSLPPYKEDAIPFAIKGLSATLGKINRSKT